MSDMATFARSCRDTSRQLRQVPDALRKALADQVATKVAQPLADRIIAAYVGPWARPLAAATKVRDLAAPTIVIGGPGRVVSGGASAAQLVYGAQWGGGSRITRVTRRTRRSRATYKAHTTRQFSGRGPATILATLDDAGAWILDAFAGIVDRVLDKVRDG